MASSSASTSTARCSASGYGWRPLQRGGQLCGRRGKPRHQFLRRPGHFRGPRSVSKMAFEFPIMVGIAKLAKGTPRSASYRSTALTNP